MEEQFLFTQIHEALDIPTPPGAYERLRTALNKKPVKPRAWPVMQTRYSKMGFRLAAGLAIVAIAVAAAAAVLAIHNASNNTSPAGSRMSIQAYQATIAADNARAAATFSAPCDIGVHAGCGADASRGIPVVQKWIDDISRPNIPTRFVVINVEMRQHLLQNLAALRDLLAASNNSDGPGMDRAFWVALYAVEWTSMVLPAIAESHQVDAATYMRLVGSETRTLDACGASCGFTGNATTCMRSDAPLTCKDLFDSGLGSSFAGYAGDLVKEAAPPSLAAKDTVLQNDLARADAVLMTMRVAVAANDQQGFNLGMAQLQMIKKQIDLDGAKITG